MIQHTGGGGRIDHGPQRAWGTGYGGVPAHEGRPPEIDHASGLNGNRVREKRVRKDR